VAAAGLGIVASLGYAELTGGISAGRPVLIAAVLISAWIGGMVSGLTTGLLSTFFVVLYDFTPSWRVAVSPDDMWLLLPFAAITIFVTFAASWRARVEQDLRTAQEELHEAKREIESAFDDVKSALQRAEEALLVKQEFLGLISHELKSPATFLQGAGLILSDREVSDEDKERLYVDIANESRRLAAMIDDLLTLARLGVGDLRPGDPMRLQRILPEIVSDLRQRINRPGAIEVEIGHATPIISADRGYLERILENLLRNADKYSPKHEPILLFTATSEEHVIVSVLDRGPGVLASELEDMFNQFYRSGRTASLAPGLGIGLTVCKRLVDAQGGQIWAELPPDGGLKVSFSLRIATLDAGESRPASDQLTRLPLDSSHAH